jgi:hypothetical protein
MSAAALCGREGALVSVSISVDPRSLESLLETLAQLNFPINPQIYHDAALVYRYPDRHEETEATTLVEFPAYDVQLDEVRGALARFGFDPRSLYVTGMLDEIHDGHPEEPAPAGASYVSRVRMKSRTA